MNLLIISLIMIAPHVPHQAVALELAVVGAGLTLGTLRASFSHRDLLAGDTSRKDILRGCLLMLLCGVGLLAVSRVLLAGRARALLFLLAPTVGLLVGSARNAWRLLRLLGARSKREDPESQR